MTTAKQIKGLFRPLLERNPDLVQIGAFTLWVRPVHHIALRITVDRTSDPDRFEAKWNLTPIYGARPDFHEAMENHHGAFYPERYDPLPHAYWRDPDLMRQVHELCRKRRAWRWSDARIPADFVRVVETDVLPFLCAMRDHERFAAYHRSHIVPGGTVQPETRLAIDLAQGDLDAAAETWLDLVRVYEQDTCAGVPSPIPPMPGHQLRRSSDAYRAYERAVLCANYRWRRARFLEVGEPLRAGDRAALATILHRWEAETVRGAPYESLWQPTPFPLESRT